MDGLKKSYNYLFMGFLLSVVVVFFYLRPLSSPWHPFIAGDGLGYYSYLPAKFIYGDKDYDFKWFNKAHNANYVYSTFPNPEDNLLVKYGNKRINKYYQGLSYIWLPFFVAAHTYAKVFGYPKDGYSPPYQLFIGLASLLYILLGLTYLRKLLNKLFDNNLVAVLVPIIIFYSTYLFTYSISFNSHSHAYSFTFVTLFVYFMVSFFKDDDKKLRNFLLCTLCFIICVCIRPLTGVIILIVPLFIPEGFFKSKLRFSLKVTWVDILILLLALGCLWHTARIMYIQTGSLFAYSYTNEKFDFAKNKFVASLFSYNLGLFVYVPSIFISLFGIPFLKTKQRIFLPIFFFAIIFLYSAWWFWPIVKRAIIDFYVLPSIFMAALLNAYTDLKRVKITLLALFGLSIFYFQLKNMQISKGILDETATYKEVFWRNFFRVQNANTYLVPPSTIIKQISYEENFEGSFTGNKSSVKKYEGQYSNLLDSSHPLSKIAELPFPQLFSGTGFKKIRLSLQSYFAGHMEAVHVFIQFYDKENKLLKDIPFYLNADYLPVDKWDYKEFGFEIGDGDDLNANTVSKITFSIWNVDAKKDIFIDNAKVEFILADKSFETIK